jgi:uncharacterized membrane protein
MALDTVTDLQLEIRKVNNQQPWLWLQQGFADFLRAFPVSVSYGLILALLSMGVTAGLYAAHALHWLLPTIGGFFLVAPLLATGFYGCSRALEENRVPVFKDAFDAFQNNLSQIILMGVELIVIYIAWIRVALLLFAFFYGTYPPESAQAFYWMLFSTAKGWTFLLTGTIVGFLFALATFALSVVAIPMLIEHKISVLEANVHSLKAFAANPWPMLLWAALIVIFMIAGLVTFYLGLAIVFPVIGHATWHVYRDAIAH